MVYEDIFNPVNPYVEEAMDKLGELKNQLYNFMRNLSHEKPSDDKLDSMLKLMGLMEDVLYEIKKPTLCELRDANMKMIARLRAEHKTRTDKTGEPTPRERSA